MGRKTKLTPQLQEHFVAALRGGNYLTTTCDLCGIAHVQFYSWMQKGLEGREPYKSFREAVTCAQAEAESAALKVWQDAMPKDWRAAAEWCARRHTGKWGVRQRLEVIADRERIFDVLERVLPTEHYARVLDALADGADAPGETAGNNDSGK